MSDKQFKEYSTSSAFRIDLSKKMCEMLLSLYGDTFISKTESGLKSSMDAAWNLCRAKEMHNDSYITTGAALARRGLAEYIMGEGYKLTNAGIMIVPLLRIAGFKSYQERLKEIA